MKKILFVEDEPDLQAIIRALLKDEGYQVVSALDGEEGLKLAKSETPDLILLDLILPKIQGLDILRQLKENVETKEIPVIVLTVLGGTGDAETAITLGAAAYLVKANYTPDEIASKIKKILRE